MTNSFFELNRGIFDFIVSKNARLVGGIIYFLAVWIALVHFGSSLEIKNNNGGLEMDLIYYVSILCFITVVAYCAFLRFTQYAKDIVQKANDVGLEDFDMQKVRRFSYCIMQKGIPVFALLTSIGVAFIFVKHTELELSSTDGLEACAIFLVFFAALSTILAYAALILDICAINVVYSSTFHTYVFFYPVSTKIFRYYNKIIISGLIRFWFVGSCVLFLTFVVVAHKGPIFLTIVGLALSGFVLFTFFPFYITKKKIIELKMDTISQLVSTSTIYDTQRIQNSGSVIKFIQESPSQISTNYYALYGSTILAVISAIISLKDLLPTFP